MCQSTFAALTGIADKRQLLTGIADPRKQMKIYAPKDQPVPAAPVSNDPVQATTKAAPVARSGAGGGDPTRDGPGDSLSNLLGHASTLLGGGM